MRYHDELNDVIDHGIYFKRDFIVTFLATWCANNYAEKCVSGDHESLYNPPVDDAIDIADKIWKNMQNER